METREIFVTPKGGFDGSAKDKPCTLHEALEKIEKGDVLNVAAGVYCCGEITEAARIDTTPCQ